MNLLSLIGIRRKPEPIPHVVVRHVVATKAESRLVQRKRADVEMELAIYNQVTTPEYRRAAFEDYVRKARETQEARFQRAVAAGAMDGLTGRKVAA